MEDKTQGNTSSQPGSLLLTIPKDFVTDYDIS